MYLISKNKYNIKLLIIYDKQIIVFSNCIIVYGKCRSS